ncbi:hypothetical protein A9Q81_18805 [Gammaproteobacteria bacterium 42_54_T18]|nr:hypothetical protein A9Q81_18805 [Gammaproteobacteria bacterium 42_54_T18]
MNQSTLYKTSSAFYEDIHKHLLACDKSHNPKLSKKLNIADYAKKLFEKSVTFEAWYENDLIGLISAYLDNEKQGFITNVSIVDEHLKKGIANALMQRCINDAKSKGILNLSLEVSTRNSPAINLYKKVGFENHYQKTSSIIMRLNLKG